MQGWRARRAGKDVQAPYSAGPARGPYLALVELAAEVVHVLAVLPLTLLERLMQLCVLGDFPAQLLLLSEAWRV